MTGEHLGRTEDLIDAGIMGDYKAGLFTANYTRFIISPFSGGLGHFFLAGVKSWLRSDSFFHSSPLSLSPRFFIHLERGRFFCCTRCARAGPRFDDVSGSKFDIYPNLSATQPVLHLWWRAHSRIGDVLPLLRKLENRMQAHTRAHTHSLSHKHIE